MKIDMRVVGYGMLAMVMGASAAVANGQEKPYDPATAGAPPLLMTVREYPKLGMESAHMKSEAAMAQLMAEEKAPDTYLAMESITGSAPRVVFFRGYSTMAEMETRYEATMKISGLSEKLDRMNMDDEAMLTGTGTAVWRRLPDLSSPGIVNMAEMRMAELVEIETKPGHGDEFEAVAKRVITAWSKADPDYHADIYEMTLGTHDGPVYLVILPIKSLGVLDKLHDEHDAFMKALGMDGSKSDKEAAMSAYASSDSNLFVFSPRMSNLPESWTKYAPEYWKPKPMEKKAAEKK